MAELSDVVSPSLRGNAKRVILHATGRSRSRLKSRIAPEKVVARPQGFGALGSHLFLIRIWPEFSKRRFGTEPEA
jgi:hypothetical protein